MSIDSSIFGFTDNDINSLLTRNKNWAQRTSALRPGLFPSLANSQHPQILWIGCSDSRVPETTVLNLMPGEIFTHRNIANLLPSGDLSSLSVIQYAVEILKVKHVIVCGHYGCGGVMAALGDKKHGIVDHWLQHLRDVRAANKAELAAISDPAKRVERLVELNVIAQINNLKRHANVQEAIRDRGLEVHGFVYDVSNGLCEVLEVPKDPEEAEYNLRT
ncbi:carbonic anhydrase [Tuber borchii]|uniref:Carbonic anhydrase n=1 Tax=Tuber borchii TaxID=42251 RepID=A0A2T6ZQ48_TUBBO|nr:carbonic anhydrase [Tuber borchii]